MTAFLFAVFGLALFVLALLVVAWAGVWAWYLIEEGLYRISGAPGLWRGTR